MAIQVTVPRLGWSMDEGTFVEWLKQDGEWVAAGDMLFILEGEKASQEVESFDEGFLRLDDASPRGGEDVAVGQVLAHLTAEGEQVPALQAVEQSTAATTNELAAPTAAAVAVEANRTAQSPATRLCSTPRARRVAAELGVNWSTLSGTGREGRIRECDVRAAATTPAATSQDNSGGELIRLTSTRRLIANRMSAGVHQAAPVTLTSRVDATALVDLRKAARRKNSATTPSYNDMFVYLAGRALKQHAILQGQWRDDGIWIPEDVNINIAVDTNEGLLAPVIKSACNKSLAEISAESRSLADAAINKKLEPAQLQGGTFTITNLGAFGIDAFTPIINLPQSAILGVGRIIREPVVVRDGLLTRSMVTLSLTFDHRVMDGAAAARFLQDLSQAMEEFQ